MLTRDDIYANPENWRWDSDGVTAIDVDRGAVALEAISKATEDV